MSRLQIAWIVYNIGPYHHRRFEALCERGDIALTVLEVVGLDPNSPWSRFRERAYAVVPLSGREGARGPLGGKVALRLLSSLASLEPDVVVTNGYSQAWDLWALAWAKLSARRCVTVFDSTENDRPRTHLKEKLKGLLLSRLYDGVFASGTRSHRYLQRLGVANDAIATGYDAVDNAYFAARAPAPDVDLPAGPFFVSVSRLSREKNIEALIDAYGEYSRRLVGSGEAPWPLVICGGGPLEIPLRAQANRVRDGNIRMIPYTRYERLPGIYQRSACFVLASTSEPWGLVVNEALAAGIPVLVSEKCGCVPDLIAEGETGYSFPPTDRARLAQLLSLVSALPAARRRQMGENGRRRVASFGLDSWTTNATRILDGCGLDRARR